MQLGVREKPGGFDRNCAQHLPISMVEEILTLGFFSRSDAETRTGGAES